MVQYLETIGVALLAVCGVLLGRACSRLRKPYWSIGYVLPFVLIGMVVAARWSDTLAFHDPFNWLMAGRREFVALSFACTTLLTTSLARLSHKRQKVMVCMFMVTAVAYFSILPFVLPAILQNRLSALETYLDPSGVCIQGTSYTCGPAAAVTALRQLGFQSNEGEIAVAAYTNPVSGTPPDLLCAAIEELYGDEGLDCEYRCFHSVTDLRDAGTSIVGTRLTFMADHYVAVLEVTHDKIVLGDPLEGRRVVSHDKFRNIWRYDGIVLKRDGADLGESGILHAHKKFVDCARRGDTEAIEQFLKSGMDVDAKDDGGWTALMHAAEHGHIQAAKTLLANGADADARDYAGHTALMNAAWQGHTQIAEALIDNEAEVAYADALGWTALMNAALRGHLDTAGLLLDNGVDPDDFGLSAFARTPLMIAAGRGHTDIVNLLLDKGAEVDWDLTEDGKTALIIAAAKGQTDAVKILLQAGADIYKKDDNGRTALYYAERGGHKEIADLLIKAGGKR